MKVQVRGSRWRMSRSWETGSGEGRFHVRFEEKYSHQVMIFRG